MTKATTINENGTSAKDVLLYTAGGILLIGGGFFLVRKIVRTVSEKKVEQKSLEEGTPESYAKGLKMAFENDGWPGTKMAEVRRIMTEIPSKEFFKSVQKEYQKLYHHPLNKDISSDLQSSEYREVISILAAKPDKKIKGGIATSYNYLALAKRLKAAFDKEYGIFPGTDEPAIKAVFFEIPTQAAFLKVAEAYLNEYHTSLIDDLKGELEFWEYSDYMKIITNKPK
jgi:hypothetical protein